MTHLWWDGLGRVWQRWTYDGVEEEWAATLTRYNYDGSGLAQEHLFTASGNETWTYTYMYLTYDYLRHAGGTRQRKGEVDKSYTDYFLLTDMGTISGRFTRGSSLSLEKAQREIAGDRQARYSVAGGPPTTGDFTDVSNLGFASTYIESFGGTKSGDAQFFDALNQFGDRHYLPGLGRYVTPRGNNPYLDPSGELRGEAFVGGGSGLRIPRASEGRDRIRNEEGQELTEGDRSLHDLARAVLECFGIGFPMGSGPLLWFGGLLALGGVVIGPARPVPGSKFPIGNEDEAGEDGGVEEMWAYVECCCAEEKGYWDDYKEQTWTAASGPFRILGCDCTYECVVTDKEYHGYCEIVTPCSEHSVIPSWAEGTDCCDYYMPHSWWKSRETETDLKGWSGGVGASGEDCRDIYRKALTAGYYTELWSWEL